MPSFCSNGRLACQTNRAESGAVSRRKAKIDPEVQKRDNESPAKQLPPQGPECPEDAAVAELPHPQPLLYPAGDDRQESDEYDRCNHDKFQRTPSPEDAVIFRNSMLFACKRPWRLAVCWFLDHCSTPFSLGPKRGLILGSDDESNSLNT